MNPPERLPDLLEISRRLDQLSKALVRWANEHRTGLSSILDKEPTAWISAGPAEAARMIRRIIRRRRLRNEMFPLELFADPAWDILLELTASRLEGQSVPVSSLCIAATVPTTTALRWINTMIEAGWLVRRSDGKDRRRVLIELSPLGWELMSNYFARIALESEDMGR